MVKEDYKWICSRCASRKKVEHETDPVVLRVCDWCNIKNWTRPVGHNGANAGTGRVMPVKVSAKGDRLPLYDKKKRKKAAKAVPVVEEAVEAVEEVPSSTGTDDEAVPVTKEAVVEEAVSEAVEEAEEENITQTIDEQIAELEIEKEKLEAQESEEEMKK